ncbi:MAG: PQQ-binding-like beta-propeller repeat protein, partial [Planctomycetaceae bacterium]
QWGGPGRDLIWRETGIVRTLQANPSGALPRMWTAKIGAGYAGPAVANGHVYVTDRLTARNGRQQTERVLCFNAESGQPVWSHEYDALYTVSYPAGPRSTPVIDEGRVFTIGAMGHMFCLAEKTGEILWQKNFVEQFGTRLPAWGMVASPLIDGRQVIMLVGGADGALVVSFDKTTGQELWRSLTDPSVGYAPPVIFSFGGQRQLIVWHPTAVSALNPTNGSKIWEIPCQVRAGLSIATPRRVGNRLFVASFYNGPRMIEVAGDGQSARLAWAGKSDSEKRTDGVHPIMCTPFFDGKYIYSICSYGELRCLDAASGQRLWSTLEATGRGRWWNAFLIRHQDRFFIHNEQGELIIASLTPQGYREISRARLIKPTRPVQRRQTIWSHPAFAMQSIFARNDGELIRVSLKQESREQK